MPFRRNGVRPSSFDVRDYIFQPAAIGMDTGPRDKSGGLPELPWPSWNQGDKQGVPCCVSISVVTAMELLDAHDSTPERLSVLFHYFMSRPIADRMSALELRQGLHSAVTRGVCLLPLHEPQSPEEVISSDAARVPPDAAAEEDALRHALVNLDRRTRRRRYWQLSDTRRVDDWRAALNSRNPVICVFPITEGYFQISEDPPVHGDIHGRPVGAGLHAVVTVLYDDDRKAVKMRDSRGPGFADNGHWWMPYSLIRSPWFIEEAWTLTTITY